MADTRTDDLIYNPERVKEARDLLDEIKEDIASTDNMLYDAVMKIGYAQGIEDVEQDDVSIDMRMPEKLMIQCRDETKFVDQTFDDQVQIIENFIYGENRSGTGGTVTAELTDLGGGMIREDGTLVEDPGNNQALYGPPPGDNTKPIGTGSDGGWEAQPLYGVPSTDVPITTPPSTPEGTYQPLYGVPSTEVPITTPPSTPEGTYQPLYGVLEPTVEPITRPESQLLYGPPPTDTPTTPVTTPTTTPHTGEEDIPQYDVYVPTTGSPTTPTTTPPDSDTQMRITDDHSSPTLPQDTDPGVNNRTGESSTLYSAIPETGVAMEKSYDGYILPTVVGLGAGLAGIGIAHKRQKDEEKEEDERRKKRDRL